MNIYQDLEDALYNLVYGLFPAWTTIFAYTNGPEPVSPYCVINVRKLDVVGQQYTSHLATADPYGHARTMTIQDSLTQVRFEFHGKYDANTTTAEMAQQLELAMRTPKGFELMKLNNLSLHKKMSARRMPVKRDTDMYMVYQLDVTFAYCSMTIDEIDWIETAGITGIYHDAGREPDHIIINKIDVTENPNP
ncbi:hypothetical protein uav_107 [Pseudomonas phage UAVern]|uniref:Phage neck terminator protein gp12-like domain-containing protein n=1 Tax=Pseudomonas phage UAVern TaxID=2856997 RepID=A0A975UUH3_9CAUD|nr:hypothetical protein uav_107 [Pseudomonas phage UAVern]